MTTYAPRPSEDPGPPMWDAEDLAAATRQGRHDLIEQARAAGQLDNLLRDGLPERDVDADRAAARAALIQAQMDQHRAREEATR